MYSRLIPLMIVVLLTSGCAEYPIKSSVRDDFQAMRFSITPGITTRDQVRNLLGEPSIVSDRWRFEVYPALSGRDVLMAGPIIPILYITKDVILYTLIVYDDNNIVKDIDWDITEGITEYSDSRYAKLNAGGLEYISHKFELGWHSRDEIVLAPKTYSQNLLHKQPPPKTCTLFLALDPDQYMRRVSLNGNPLLEDVFNIINIGIHKIPVFVMMLVPNGEHLLTVHMQFRVQSKWKAGYFQHAISCNEDKNIFISLEATIVEKDSWLGWRHHGELVVSDIPAEIFLNSRQLLYSDETWFGEH